MTLTATAHEDLLTLHAVIDRLTAADPAVLADGATLVQMQREHARLDAVMTRATGVFDAERRYAPDTAQTAAAWLATRCRLPRQTAGRRVRLARKLRSLPVTEQAWVEGDISADHVSTIASAHNPRTADKLRTDEELLVGFARTAERFGHFAKSVAYWLQLADQDGAEDDDESRRDRRSAYVSTSLNGMVLGKLELDPVSGAVFHNEFKAREQELYDADVAAATARLGRAPFVWELDRTAAQRRADALVEMAIRSATTPAGGQRPAPLFSVLVDFDTLNGRVLELANGTVLAPGSIVPWLTEADIERAVWRSRTRVEVSETSRLFTGGTRRAVQLRDLECTNEFCDVPAAECEIDHVIPDCWGGPTNQANAQVLCHFHNRLKARGERASTKPPGLDDEPPPPPPPAPPEARGKPRDGP